MEETKKNRPKVYLKSGQSDYIVDRVFQEREWIVYYNPSEAVGGAKKRDEAWKRVVSAVKIRFPELEVEQKQIKANFEGRIRALREKIAKRNAYRNATGGGTDDKMEKLCVEIENPSMIDGKLKQMIMKHAGSLGVGPNSLETGHKIELPPSVARCQSKSTKPLSGVSLTTAKELSLREFLRATEVQRKRTAKEEGFRGEKKKLPHAESWTNELAIRASEDRKKLNDIKELVLRSKDTVSRDDLLHILLKTPAASIDTDSLAGQEDNARAVKRHSTSSMSSGHSFNLDEPSSSKDIGVINLD